MSTYRMAEVLPLVDSISQQMGVPSDVVRSMLIAENSSDGKLDPQRQLDLATKGIDPATGKPSGALGLFQLVGTTFQNLKTQGKLPSDINYGTLEGQVTAGVAAVKDVLQATNGDPRAAAALWVNGQAGLRGYRGAGPMPDQAKDYLKKFDTAMGNTVDTSTSATPKTATSAAWTAKRIPEGISAELNSDMAAYNAASATNLPILRAMGVASDAAAGEMKAGIQDAAAAAEGTINAAASRDEQEVNQRKQLLGVFGLQEAQIVDQMTAVAAEEAKAQENKVVMDQLMAINPMANPVKWLVAQMQLGAIVPQYNSAVQNVNRMTDQIATKQAMAIHQKSLTPAVQLSTIEEERVAKIQLNAATARAQLAKVDMENISGRSKMMSEELQWLGQSVNMSLASARLQAETLGIRRDETAKTAEQGVLDKVNLLRTQLGAPAIPTMQQFKALPKDQQDFLINASTEGKSPAKTIRNVVAMGTVTTLQREPMTSAMGDQIVAIGDAVKKDVDALVATKGMKYMDALEKAVADKDAFWRAEIVDGDMTKASANNPYRMNPMQYAMSPELKGNSFAEFVSGSGKTIPNLGEKEILAYAVGQVKAGTKSVDQVSTELYDFFTKGFEYQWKVRGMGTIGFDPRTYRPPGQQQPATSYAVSGNIFGWYDRTFGGSPAPDKPIQLMNETSIKHFLTMASVRDIQMKQATSVQSLQKAQDDAAAARFGVTQ